MLTRTGLGPALSTYFGRLGRPDALRLGRRGGRPEVQRPHRGGGVLLLHRGGAGRDRDGPGVRSTVAGDELVIEITGAAQTDTDLAAMVDRVEALGGSLQLSGNPRQRRRPAGGPAARRRRRAHSAASGLGMTWRARLAWAMAGISLAATTADTVILARAVGLLSAVAISEKSWPLIDAAAVGSSVVGALIVSRLPRHPIGWLLSVVGLVGAIALVGETYSVWVVEEGGPGPTSLGHAVGWVAALVGSPLILSMLAVMFLVAPDGRLLSPGWRVAVAASVTGSACFATALLLVPPTQFDFRGESQENSVDSGTAGTVLIICFLLLTVATLVAAAVSMVIRFRRAEGVLRQQLWCFALSACFLAFGVAWLLAVRGPIEDPADAWIATLPLALAYFMLPILTGTAVLRYRLYNVDLVVNRAVLLAVGTAFAAAGYVVVVVAVSSVMGTRAGNVWLSLLALAVVALAFQPMRRQLTRLADRLVYGSRAVPYDALSAFSRRLGNTPDPAALLPAVAQAVGRAVSARSATARLQLAGTASIQATWSAAGRARRRRRRARPASTARSRWRTRPAISAPSRSSSHPAGSCARTSAGCWRTSPSRRRWRSATPGSRPSSRRTSLRWTARPRRWRRRVGGCSRPRTSAAAGWRPPSPATCCLTSRCCPRSWTGCSPRPTPRSPGRRSARLVDRTTAALDQLRTLTRGIFPTTLARSGIGPALASHFAGAGDGTSLHVDDSAADRRFPSRVETAAYFCCTRAADGGRDRDGRRHHPRPRRPGPRPARTRPGPARPPGDGRPGRGGRRLGERGRAPAGPARPGAPARAGGGLALGRRWRRPTPRPGGPGRTPPWARTPQPRSPRGRTRTRRTSRAGRPPARPAAAGSCGWPRCRRCRAGSRPSGPGPDASSSAAVTDSSPEATAPTTSKPSVASTTADMALRNGSWSSTTRTRTTPMGTPPATIIGHGGARQQRAVHPPRAASPTPSGAGRGRARRCPPRRRRSASCRPDRPVPTVET